VEPHHVAMQDNNITLVYVQARRKDELPQYPLMPLSLRPLFLHEDVTSHEHHTDHQLWAFLCYEALCLKREIVWCCVVQQEAGIPSNDITSLQDLQRT
jgi:hypothetical protein